MKKYIFSHPTMRPTLEKGETELNFNLIKLKLKNMEV